MSNLLTVANQTVTLPNSFCTETQEIWKLVGWFLMVFKIVIPILIIIFGMVDLGKAVIASKDDEIKKATVSLLKRAIAGIVIFFVPTIVSLVIGLVDGEGKWNGCKECISNPNNAACGSAQ